MEIFSAAAANTTTLTWLLAIVGCALAVVGPALARRGSAHPAASHVDRRGPAGRHRTGGRVDAIFFCPHAAQSDCECRKPKTGMLEEIGQRFNATLAEAPTRFAPAATIFWRSPAVRTPPLALTPMSGPTT